VRSAREDGSWPIDTNLATWVTTLAVNALVAADDLESLDTKDELRDWLLRQQYTERHPYTGADPGGWAWTDLPGGVPDADDTPGAIIARRHLDGGKGDEKWGIRWLLGIQNRDGGWPTFCRGWGKLPFDRSGPDLTAHALRAIGISLPHVQRHMRDFLDRQKASNRLLEQWHGLSPVPLERALSGGLAYLARQQRPDGSWLPLWFGNQHAPDDENPTYGTARVLAAYRDLKLADSEPARRGVAWLLANQNDDGGWGGGRGTPSSVEETALAVEVLIDLAPPDDQPFVQRGLAWLVEAVESDRFRDPAPIGFYFAKLWYFEGLYPIIFTVAALGRACRTFQD
jgi:squalene-hopene/tetraprenyl-beta-curcumene cyclase